MQNPAPEPSDEGIVEEGNAEQQGHQAAQPADLPDGRSQEKETHRKNGMIFVEKNMSLQLAELVIITRPLSADEGSYAWVGRDGRLKPDTCKLLVVG